MRASTWAAAAPFLAPRRMIGSQIAHRSARGALLCSKAAFRRPSRHPFRAVVAHSRRRAARVPPISCPERSLPPRCARKDGFSLHAGSAVHANDHLGLERLARYSLRPPLALGRLTQDPDGTLRYEMKRRLVDGRKVLTFTPRDFLLRLCALVPPPRVHVVRYASWSHSRATNASGRQGRRDARDACGEGVVTSRAE